MKKTDDKKNESDTIKSVTRCPTCGSECTVGGEGETHYYIPLKEKKIDTF